MTIRWPRRLSWPFGSPSKTVLVAWEMGGGLGHLKRLLPIAKALKAQGHRIVFALRSTKIIDATDGLLEQAIVLQAPYFGLNSRVSPKELGFFKGTAAHYADILGRSGYDSSSHLGELVIAWRRMFTQVKPALIVCDFSPTIVLANAGRIPIVHIGSGFALPPVGKPLRCLSIEAKPGAKQREAEVLKSIRNVQASIGTPISPDVSDLLSPAVNIACCLPELDPYASERTDLCLGPTSRLPTLQALPKDPSLFGYLNGRARNVPAIVKSLANANVRARIYIRGANSECEAAALGSNVTIFDAPQNLNDSVTNASAILHHGGIGTAEASLAAGRPQFLLPEHLEQMLTATAIQKFGCGINLVGKNFDPGAAIRVALEKGTYIGAASAIAERIAARAQGDALGTIIQICEKYLSTS